MQKIKKHYSVSPLNVSDDSWHSRGYLPHMNRPEMTYFVTLRLFDSLPKHVVSTLDPEILIDEGHGECFLQDPNIASMIEKALIHFHGTKYELHEWVIMPNHMHFLFTLLPSHLLDKTIHSLKSFSAHEGNNILERSGPFWFKDYFDRYIRDSSHFERTKEYIRYNPVQAKLCISPQDWRFGSAFYKSSLRA